MSYSKNKVDIEIKIMTQGGSFEIKRGTALRLISISGLDFPEVEESGGEYAFDGGYINAKRYAMRNIALRFGIANLPGTENLRQEIISGLDPKERLTLEIKRNGKVRRIEAEIVGKPEIEQSNYIYDRAKVGINFLSPDPLFYNPSAKTAVFLNGSAAYSNEGDEKTGFSAVLTAAGNCTDPEISLGNSRIKVIGEFAAGDVLRISTIARSRHIKKNDVDYMFFDPGSSFFELPKGAGTLTLAGGNIGGTISFNERFRGV